MSGGKAREVERNARDLWPAGARNHADLYRSLVSSQPIVLWLKRTQVAIFLLSLRAMGTRHSVILIAL